MEPVQKLAAQIVGNVGLYYVCYRLSRLGWNVMPTTRNARGIDVLIYNQDGTRSHTLQVKALSKPSPVPLGRSVDRLMGDFFVVCRNVRTDAPECFVLLPSEVCALAHKGEKNGQFSYWLQPAQYAKDQFRDNWSRIGYGAIPEVTVQQPEGHHDVDGKAARRAYNKKRWQTQKELLVKAREYGLMKK